MDQAQGHWQDTSVPCLIGLSTWLFEYPYNMGAASPKASDLEKGESMDKTKLHSMTLVSVVTHHHICLILLVKEVESSPHSRNGGIHLSP